MCMRCRCQPGGKTFTIGQATIPHAMHPAFCGDCGIALQIIFCQPTFLLLVDSLGTPREIGLDAAGVLRIFKRVWGVLGTLSATPCLLELAHEATSLLPGVQALCRVLQTHLTGQQVR